MTASYAVTNGARYRYYVSCVLAQGRKHDAGSVPRPPAPEIEAIVLKALRDSEESAEKDSSEREVVHDRPAGARPGARSRTRLMSGAETMPCNVAPP
ncbi:MAG: Recombinase family protein [Microvirga sp.]|jgi:site-specific DNA recombinase|nr:Recombinase family protein [Microvirga sp.]MDF2974627.1 Recombinase family protein [Microvirga sp.]